MDRVIRSLFWMTGFSVLGYGLFVVASPSKEKIEKLRKDLPGVDSKKESLVKNEQFFNVLNAARESNKPLYRMSREELNKEIQKVK